MEEQGLRKSPQTSEKNYPLRQDKNGQGTFVLIEHASCKPGAILLLDDADPLSPTLSGAACP